MNFDGRISLKLRSTSRGASSASETRSILFATTFLSSPTSRRCGVFVLKCRSTHPMFEQPHFSVREFPRKWFGNSRRATKCARALSNFPITMQINRVLRAGVVPPAALSGNRFLQDCRNFNAYWLAPPVPL